MAYEIPKNLTKYSEVFLWGFTFKQFGILALTIIICGFIILKAVQIHLIVRMVLTLPIFIFGLMFAFGKIDEKYKHKRNLDKSMHNVAYYDSKILNFNIVKEIADDVVVLKNGTLLAVLKVIPLDFAILGKDAKEYTLKSYSKWLRSLAFPVQIISRSVELDVNKWIKRVEKRKSVKYHKPHYKVFKEWLKNDIEENNVRNRLFYIVVPLKADIAAKSDLKDFLNLIKGKSFETGIDTSAPAYQKAVKQLDDRIKNCQEALKPCGITTKRLEKQELLGLYSSYFTNVAEIDQNLLTPIMWLKKDQTAKQDKIYARYMRNVQKKEKAKARS